MLSFAVDEEIELRLPRIRDAQAHVELLGKNREYLGRWLPWARAERTVEQEREAIARLRLAHAREQSLSFAIWYRGAFAGITGLYAVDESRGTASLGFWLGEEFAGKAIVTRASAPILRHAFEELGLVSADADPDADNLRSIATLERLGFQREGGDRRSGAPGEPAAEVVVYVLRAEGWRTRSGTTAR